MNQALLNYFCNSWSVKTGICFRYGKRNLDVGKLFGHKKQYDSQQMKTQPPISTYIEILCILLAINSNC